MQKSKTNRDIATLKYGKSKNKRSEGRSQYQNLIIANTERYREGFRVYD
jgi:hypothetical protein